MARPCFLFTLPLTPIATLLGTWVNILPVAGTTLCQNNLNIQEPLIILLLQVISLAHQVGCLSINIGGNSFIIYPDLPLSLPTLPNPVNHPAPGATFGNHFSAAQASIAKCLPPTPSQERARIIYQACQVLAKSCVACWAQDFDYLSHSLLECPRTSVKEGCEAWDRWKVNFTLPAGVCFYCGLPLKVRHSQFKPSSLVYTKRDSQMTFMSNAGQELRLHEHPSNKTCHWRNILKPLAFTVLGDHHLSQILASSRFRNGNHIESSGNTYVRWLCRVGENELLNLLNVFLVLLEFRGPPSIPDISALSL
jgi:hypothetical protein